MGQIERNKRTTWLQFFWVLSDLTAIFLGVIGGYLVRFRSPFAQWVPPVNAVPPFDIYLLAAVAAVVVWVPLFHALGLYRVDRGRARHRRADLVRGLVLGALVLATVGFFYRGASFSRVGMILTWILTSGFVLLGRSLVHAARRRFARLVPIHFAVAGEGPLVRRVVEALCRSSYPHECVGVFPMAPQGFSAPAVVPRGPGIVSPSGARGEPAVGPQGTTARVPERGRSEGPGNMAGSAAGATGATPIVRVPMPGTDHVILEGTGGERWVLPLLGPLESLGAVAERYGLDLIVAAAGSGTPADLERAYQQCQRLDLDFQFVPEVFSLWGRAVKIEDLDGLPLLRLRELRLGGWNGVLKRTLDLLVAVPLLIGLLPLYGVLAVAVKVSSPGPVFHRQERVGRDRRTFAMIKFRSMRVDAERETGPVWASANDPRRTDVGAFLRKWSLDELPQLWNVFRGDMSLVGPRPERPVFVEEFESRVQDYYDRHRIKSGVTGWAQVHGLRGNVPIEQRTAYDLYYVENWSIWLDLRILWMTLWAVVAHRGE